jgi:hypothetical protein
MDMNKELALEALKLLDQKMLLANEPRTTLIIGGGGSMILNFNYHGATIDIDAVPLNSEFEDLKPYMAEVAQELKIAADWLNPYYQAFTHYLPRDAKVRMKSVFNGDVLEVKSLGAEDIMIMKLMAGRAKDFSHIQFLLKMKIDLKIVDHRLTELLKIHPILAQKALDSLDSFTEGRNE